MFGYDHTPILRLCCERGLKEIIMPAKSKKQQMAAGAALAAKKGKRASSSLRGASKSMYESMGEGELERMASAQHKGEPTTESK
jgi:hypothetical protein